MPRKLDEKTPKRTQGIIKDTLILKFLQDHPNFIADHPELLDSQNFPGRFSNNGVADFQHFLVERLRNELGRMRAQQEEIISNSRDNQTTQERIHHAVIDLLDAESFTQFVEIIVSDLAVQLDVDAVRLCIEKSGTPLQEIRLEGLRLLEKGAVMSCLGKSKAVLREESPEDPEIFGEVAPLIRSDALVRLEISSAAPAAMLAFGTRHPGYFHSGQGTELLSFLSNVIAFGLRAWLDLPKA